MLTRLANYLMLFVLTTAPLLIGNAQEPSAKFDSASSTGAPGGTIPAGSYTMRVRDHLSDRYIMDVQDKSGKVLATFLGLPNKALASSRASGKLIWPDSVNGLTYLKGWNFSEESLSLEFVYPKGEAVALAKANHARVAAIDPQSDGLVASATGYKLSDQDLKVVTLWLLTPTHVGAGIAATKYDQVASLEKPKLKQLPHTASEFWWFYIVLAAASGAALTIRLSRTTT